MLECVYDIVPISISCDILSGSVNSLKQKQVPWPFDTIGECVLWHIINKTRPALFEDNNIVCCIIFIQGG